jgi:hypothetical protein
MARRKFLLALAALCLFYAGLETLYVLRLPIVMDEYQGARAVHRLSEGVPYRDFKPYKTVLGYYVQLPALTFPGDVWRGLIAVKLEMVAINTLTLLVASLALARRFDRRAVLAGLSLLVVMSTFLERSPDLRVDMLTAIGGLASLLLLIERRYLWAGAACGVSFLMSQKGAYYVLAGNVALGGYLLVARDRAALKALVAFNAAAAAALGLYLGFWSAVASPGLVFGSAVGDAGKIAVETIQDIRLRYWGRTARWNPLFYGLALFALWHLDRRRRRGDAGYQEWLLLLYGAGLTVLCALHKQPWPYFFVLLIPTLWVLIVALLNDSIEWFAALDSTRRLWLVTGFVVLGIVNPLTRLPANFERDSAFQRSMLQIAQAVLEPGESYLTGVDMLWNRQQVSPELAWLDRRRLSSLRQLPPADRRQLTQRVERAPLKLVIDNYRTQQLPRELRRALDRNYGFLWGNLRLYSPALDPEWSEFHLAVGGRYQVYSDEPLTAEIDGHQVTTGETLELGPGPHRLASSTPMRLRLLPGNLEGLLDPRFRKPRPLFPNVYDY